MNTNTRQLAFLLPAFSILFLSCSATDPSDSDELTASYTITVQNPSAGPGAMGIEYPGTTTGWNPDLLSVFLGPEDVESMLGRLEFAFAGANMSQVSYARFSTSDVAVGTAAEINGKLYELDPGETEIRSIEIEMENDSVIKGSVTFLMQCASQHTCQSEILLVSATFTALDENR